MLEGSDNPFYAIMLLVVPPIFKHLGPLADSSPLHSSRRLPTLTGIVHKSVGCVSTLVQLNTCAVVSGFVFHKDNSGDVRMRQFRLNMNVDWGFCLF